MATNSFIPISMNVTATLGSVATPLPSLHSNVHLTLYALPRVLRIECRATPAELTEKPQLHPEQSGVSLPGDSSTTSKSRPS